MSAIRKYTDRDVRENPNFIDMAEEYLKQYQGEFEFLIDCKMRLAQGTELSTGMIRGVLNCMRVDPRVKSQLPEPMPEFDADVIPIYENNDWPQRREFQPKQPVVYKYIEPMPKRNDGNYSYRLPATVHPEYIFVKGKSISTKTIHLVTGAEYEWYPNTYGNQIGWTREPTLIVHTNCTFPYYLRDPKLLTATEVADWNEDFLGDTLNEHLMWLDCRYCFDGERKR